MAKRMRAKLLEIKAQLKRHMHSTVTEMGEWLRSVVRGWLNYYAVPGNSPSPEISAKESRILAGSSLATP